MKQILKKSLFLLLAVCLCLGPAAGSMNTIEVSAASSGADSKLLKKLDKTIKAAGVKADTGKDDALKLLYNYAKKKFGYARLMGFSGEKGWESKLADEMLTKKNGSCYHYAAAYALLAKRATGYPVRICWGQAQLYEKGRWQPHAWVEIKIGGKWYTFDVNAEDAVTDTLKTSWYRQKRSGMINKYYRLRGNTVNGKEVRGKVNVKL